MCRHVIRAFIVVDKAWISLWNQLIYESLEILSHCKIGVFIDAKTCRSMLNKYLQKTDSNLPDFWKGPLHLISNQVVALWITR